MTEECARALYTAISLLSIEMRWLIVRVSIFNHLQFPPAVASCIRCCIHRSLLGRVYARLTSHNAVPRTFERNWCAAPCMTRCRLRLQWHRSQRYAASRWGRLRFPVGLVTPHRDFERYSEEQRWRDFLRHEQSKSKFIEPAPWREYFAFAKSPIIMQLYKT